ncbi:MAG TPA: citrate synthase [Candidatus Limnocylindria bacterium]
MTNESAISGGAATAGAGERATDGAGGGATSETARLTYGDRSAELPVLRGTEDELAVDISRLRADTGLITMDVGYGNTGSCSSAITFLDGEAGILRYRGYPIEQLAEQSTFLEVAYLLIYGELPTRLELDAFVTEITHHTLIREEMRHFFDSFPTDAHPMAVLASGTMGLSTFYPDAQSIFDRSAVEITTLRLIAKLPTLAAWSFKKAIGHPYVYPRNDLGYSANLLHMMFAVPSEPYEVKPEVAEALDLLLILHADHEQNCSTATVRMVGSAHTNLYASISAAISALWGPLHGGANEAVINTLERIVADGGNIQKYVDRAKDPDDSFRLAGFGHRVYKNFDPRAKIIKRAAERVLAATGADDALFEVALKLEEIALRDEYFVSRKLYPNVDFYSGLIYRAIGFPKNMFTNCFAIGRLPGWIAQWREMIESKETKIGRPRQIYTGPAARDYLPIGAR